MIFQASLYRGGRIELCIMPTKRETPRQGLRDLVLAVCSVFLVRSLKAGGDIGRESAMDTTGPSELIPTRFWPWN